MSSLLSGLVSYYALEGDATDSTGTNNGTSSFLTFSLANGKIGQGVADSGGGFGQIIAPTTGYPVGAQARTHTCWMKTTISSGLNVCCLYGDKNIGLEGISILVFGDNGNVSFGFGGGVDFRPAGTVVNDGNWHFLAFTFDGTSTVEIFVDNVSAGSSSAFPLNTTSVVNFELAFDPFFPFIGSIDEIGTWTRVLTSGELTDLWNAGAGETYPFSPITLLTDLKAYYQFQGDGTDISGNGNTATPLNVVFSNANGLIAQGGGFNGTTSRFTKNSSSMLTGTNATSVSGWVREITNTGNNACPINLGSQSGTNSAFNFFIDTGSNLGLGTFSVGIPGAFIGDGNWHHACGTYDGGTSVKLYIDGVLVNSASLTMNWLNSNIRIGYLDNNDGMDDDQSFTGDIDEVGYWQRELTASEVTALYNAGAGLTYPFGLVPSAPTNPSFLFNIL